MFQKFWLRRQRPRVQLPFRETGGRVHLQQHRRAGRRLRTGVLQLGPVPSKVSVKIIFLYFRSLKLCSLPVWPNLANYWTLGNFLNPSATINLPPSPPFLGNFCKGVKIIHFTNETIFGQLLQTFGNIFLVTLLITKMTDDFVPSWEVGTFILWIPFTFFSCKHN